VSEQRAESRASKREGDKLSTDSNKKEITEKIPTDQWQSPRSSKTESSKKRKRRNDGLDKKEPQTQK
jgi:hypothetical protein